ncbi:hypothetical protein D7V88_14355 [Corallococcus terminator]|uniref:YcaO domain-containing protein n=1 Tax=Corallococcus terminator TaxID=2316733 RepID=A0A3A8IYG6_9BACT|nr:hypothetical protein D7V88_14355 [Corallococcus terminator]
MGRRVPKGYRTGTHRSVSPEETLRRVRPFMSRMGITRIATLTGLDRLGVPVVSASRPNARSLSVSQGKGLDLTAAKASALMESVESFHGEHIRLPLRLSSHDALRASQPVVDVAALPRVSGSGFHPGLRMLWIEGRDLRVGAPVWLPFELVHTDFTLPLPDGSGAFPMTSNGLASGNHLLEAISHGLCEVVERDATTLWSLQTETARRHTRLRLDTVDDPACLQVLAQVERADMEVALWETTTDVGLPAFLCTVAERFLDPLRPRAPTTGAGCHPCREVALLRALTEAIQIRTTFISGARDDLGNASCYADYLDPERWRQEVARMRGEQPVRCFQDVPTFAGQSFNEDVAWELERLVAAGLKQVVVVDLTWPEFGIPVVRVVIPGLEPLFEVAGYVPGTRGRQKLEERSHDLRLRGTDAPSPGGTA